MNADTLVTLGCGALATACLLYGLALVLWALWDHDRAADEDRAARATRVALAVAEADAERRRALFRQRELSAIERAESAARRVRILHYEWDCYRELETPAVLDGALSAESCAAFVAGLPTYEEQGS